MQIHINSNKTIFRKEFIRISINPLMRSETQYTNKGWWASTGLGKTPRSRYRGGFASSNPPPVLLIVSDILDSEIHDRTRELYSYSYLRGSYEIEADLTMH